MQPSPWIRPPSDQVGDDATEVGWLRTHRLYYLALVAILMATLVGAQWADQPRGHGAVASSSGPITVVADSPWAPVPVAQPGR